MNLVEDKIVRLVTGKPSLNEVSIAELQAIADNQPFFAVVQLLLTQKMKQENHPDTASQLQRTSLYFPNIFWLDYQLQEKVFYTEPSAKTAEPTVTSVNTEDTPPAVIEAIHSLPVEMPPLDIAEQKSELPAEEINIPETVAPVEEKVQEKTPPPAEHQSQGHGIMANVEEDLNPIFAATMPKDEPVVTFMQEEEPPVTEDSIAPVMPVADEKAEASAVTFEEEEDLPPVVSIQPPVEEAITSANTVIEEEPEIPAIAAATAETEEEDLPPAVSIQPPIEESFTEEAVEDVKFEQSIKDHFKAVIEEKPAVDEDNLSVDEIGGPESGISNMKIAEMLQQQLEVFKKPVDANAELPYNSDPYHTVDYFASQGIDVDNVPADAMVKKVKKFTDWLKQMKRISTDLSDLGTAKEDEEQVLGIAASSIKSKEVVTEAMARVLVKQGLIDKAIQVYSKLSFLNPDKSAYFASKIIELKGN